MMRFATKPSRRETLWGGIYLGLYLSVLPVAVPLIAVFLFHSNDVAKINFVYLFINFAATTVIFRKYLLRSLTDALRVPGATLWYALLGTMGALLLGEMVTSLILQLSPEFMNVNDAAINAQVAVNPQLMFIGAVILAPVSEELLFRGLIFRGLYDRSPLIAHLLTMVLFSVIHVSGYVVMYDMKTLFFCFLQYLPVGYCLNFAYRYSGSIAAPILVHMANNFLAFSAMR